MRNTKDAIDAYRKANPYRAEWYARDGTLRQMWFRTLKEAQTEANKHKDATVWKEYR